MQGSPLKHMGVVFSLAQAYSSQPGSQPSSQALLSQPNLLRPLHTIISTCLELATAAETASAIDTALYEALADALAPSSPGLCQPQGPASTALAQHAGAPELQQQPLQMVLATFIPRYLER